MIEAFWGVGGPYGAHDGLRGDVGVGVGRCGRGRFGRSRKRTRPRAGWPG